MRQRTNPCDAHRQPEPVVRACDAACMAILWIQRHYVGAERPRRRCTRHRAATARCARVGGGRQPRRTSGGSRRRGPARRGRTVGVCLDANHKVLRLRLRRRPKTQKRVGAVGIPFLFGHRSLPMQFERSDAVFVPHACAPKTCIALTPGIENPKKGRSHFPHRAAGGKTSNVMKPSTRLLSCNGA